ncbi:MAG: hypothetical protein AAAFM81_00135 [Pseudomonadota bacterium]
MSRERAAKRLRDAIARSNALHSTYSSDTREEKKYAEFIALQLSYFMPFYEDLRDRPGYSSAIDFVVSDLTGTGIASRDRELEKVAGLMTRFLPGGALDALAFAMTLNARILEINLGIAAALIDTSAAGTPITEKRYCIASRRVASMDDFDQLIGMTRQAGETLAGIVRLPMIKSLLRTMRVPARLAGVVDLHQFLERGYDTFTGLDDVQEFLDTMQSRMTEVFWRVFKTPLSQLDDIDPMSA